MQTLILICKTSNILQVQASQRLCLITLMKVVKNYLVKNIFPDAWHDNSVSGDTVHMNHITT